MTFKEMFLSETQNFCQAIEREFRKYFPKGFFECSKKKGIDGKPMYSYSFGLIGDINDVPNRIRGNDPMFHSGLIFIEGDQLELNPLQSSLYTKPEPGSYLAMGTIKTRMRKTKGDEAKLIKYFGNFFKKLRKIVDENKEDIYRSPSGNVEKYL